MSESIYVKNVDVNLLKTQRNELLIIREQYGDESLSANTLDGVVNLLESMLDLSSDNEDRGARKFPNGFSSWTETHYCIVQSIDYFDSEGRGLVVKVRKKGGIGGLWVLAEELTTKFEQMFPTEYWEENNWEEVLQEFIDKELA